MITTRMIYLFTFTFYVSLLYLRINKKLYKISLDKENITIYQEYLYNLFFLSIIILILLSILVIIKYFLRNNIKSSEKAFQNNQIKRKFITFLHKIITWYDKLNLVSKTYGVILDFIGPNYTRYLIFLAKFSLSFSEKKNTIICFLGIFLPRLLIIVIFFIEIMLGQLEYFFYSLFLLLIPLLFKFLLFILKDLGPRVLPEFKKIVKLKKSDVLIEVQTIDGSKKLSGMHFELASEYSDLNLPYILEYFYYPLLFIQGHIEHKITPIVSKFTRYSLFFYYFGLVIGLAYILFYIT